MVFYAMLGFLNATVWACKFWILTAGCDAPDIVFMHGASFCVASLWDERCVRKFRRRLLHMSSRGP